MKVIPSKCATCDHPKELAVICAHCRTLADPERLDFFELLGLAREFDLDPQELRAAYFRVSRQIHPDRVTPDSADRGQRTSARVNEAYHVLGDPVARAGYLLELAGGDSAQSDRTVPPEALAETLEIREELDAATDDAQRNSVRQRVAARHAELLERVSSLARELPGDDDLRRRLRSELNTIRYFQRLLESAEAAAS